MYKIRLHFCKPHVVVTEGQNIETCVETFQSVTWYGMENGFLEMEINHSDEFLTCMINLTEIARIEIWDE